MIGYSSQTQTNYNDPDLSRRIAEAQQKGQLMQLKPYENMAQQEQALYNMAATYNADPNGLSPSQRLYLKEMAKASGGALDISKGMAAESKATTGEHIGAFLGGIGDSLLFDLLPDRLYSDDRTAKTAGWGKLAGTVGSLAIGGYGAFNAVKAAKAASGVVSAAKIAATAADDVGKVLVKEYGNDVVKILGEEALKKTGAEIYDDVLKLGGKHGAKLMEAAKLTGTSAKEEIFKKATALFGDDVVNAANGSVDDLLGILKAQPGNGINKAQFVDEAGGLVKTYRTAKESYKTASTVSKVADDLLLKAQQQFASGLGGVAKVSPKVALETAKAAKTEAVDALAKLRSAPTGSTWLDDLAKAEEAVDMATDAVKVARKAARAGKVARYATEIASGGFRGTFGNAIAPGATPLTRGIAGFGAAGLAVPRVVRPIYNNDNASIGGTPQFRTYFTDDDRNSLPYGGANPYATGELIADGMSQ